MSKETKISEDSSTTYIHWSDIAARNVLREKGDREIYTVASGISPSGFVHIGNFREAITQDLVARSLLKLGKNVRFIYSWDDFDHLRKIPADIPNKEDFTKYLYQPVSDVPDPWGELSSYAERFEKQFEGEIKQLGLEPEYIYQSKMYRSGAYKESIIHALKNTDKIRAILDKFRTTPLSKEWLPISIYCPSNKNDRMKEISWDGEQQLSYTHKEGNTGVLKLDNESDLKHIKLPWRIDWPMRWAKEEVCFESAGKDHSSEGSSFSTGKLIVKEVWGKDAPTYLQYDFVGVKGGRGKMSSSAGGSILLTDLLEIYEPQIIRWIYASYKPNVDFSIGLDEDVVRTYEEFDRQERIVYGLEKVNAKKEAMAKRIYELSSISYNVSSTIAFQPSFRHLTVNLQIKEGCINGCKEVYKSHIKNEQDELKLEIRSRCALNWLKKYAPADFVFSVNSQRQDLDIGEQELKFLQKLKVVFSSEWENFDTDIKLHEAIYSVIHEFEIPSSDAFRILYQLLISKDKGPRLASFILSVGKERVLSLL
jgi:lysyl-tRNA synthetase, class I